MAAGDLTTVTNVKQWIGITAATDDALLTRLVSAVSTTIQTWLNRALSATAYTDVFDGTGGQRLLLTNYPLISVSSVSVDGRVIPAAADAAASGYAFDIYGVTLRGSYAFTAGRLNVSVAYTAGYAVLPVEIEQAAIELCSLRYSERRRPGVATQSIGGENVSYRDTDMTGSIKSLLSQYKKVTPV